MDKLLLYTMCFTLGGGGALFIWRFAFGLGLVDRPNERSSHAIPTPRGGGIGILAAFVVAALFLEIQLTFWLPAAFIALFSFFGDRVDMLPKLRLPVQLIAAAFFLMTPHSFLPSPLYLFPLIIFIVGTANFYNFMDGINGIAGITGVVGFGFLAYFGSYSGADSVLISVAICLSLSCLGFLPFNMPDAKVFMGDIGSVLLGFLFAGMILLLAKSVLDFVCLAGCLFPFYADELTTMVVRLKQGEKLTEAHRKHLYQYLANEFGIPHWKISTAYGILQLFVGGSCLLMRNVGLEALPLLLMLLFYFCCFAAISGIVRRKLEARVFKSN